VATVLPWSGNRVWRGSIRNIKDNWTIIDNARKR
jgi:hypothetical protein